ncbi:MAG: hypothetical protein LBQ19_04890 [Synergistaceae bacterium]|jgi:hypothetical protein|nr:hypothetical protein [Synergistaceae bacterium]
MILEASVITIKCGKTGKLFGIRVEKVDGDWVRTWAFPLKDDVAKREGYDKNVIRGSLRPTEEYPGCPYCGAQGLLLCQNCSKLSCHMGEKQAQCPWCDMSSTTRAAEEAVEISGEER